MSKRVQAGKRPSRSPAGKGSARTRGSAPPRVLLGTVVGAVFLIVIGLIFLQGQTLNRTPAAQGASGERSTWGPAGAPVQIVDYSNFGCGHCRDFALNQGKQLRADYEAAGTVRFEYKHFRLGDESTTTAAAASECAADQGRFWDYHDLLFARAGASRDAFAPANLKQYAAELGLETTQFNECLDRGTHLEKVYRDSQEGLAQGVEGTPTFFINGKKIVGALPYAAFRAEVEAALAATQ